jgi:hypothetical protein
VKGEQEMQDAERDDEVGANGVDRFAHTSKKRNDERGMMSAE